MRYVVLFLIILGCKTQQVAVVSAPSLPEPIVPVPKVKSPKVYPPFEDRWEDIGEDGSTLISKSETFLVGDRLVGLSVYQRPGRLTFINVHDDENTSVHAAKIVIDSMGGKLLQLRHTGERNIKFNHNGSRFEFDPNRMFTDVGAKETMSRMGPFSSEAHQIVRRFANILVDSLDVDVILTLHNNTEANYSAASYLSDYKTDASDVFLNPSRDPDDFFFVTERIFFEELRSRGFNVVLQNNATVTDDGSLSVLAGQRRLPYINIEAQHGHLVEQIEMLYVMYDMFN